MRTVIIGDIGWRNFYHLGDEAMTDFALEAVRLRGASHVTLIAGDPVHAAELYGVDTVARMGFSPSRPKNRRRADAILAAASGEGPALSPGDSAHAVIEAVRDADAVLIAGGGNLNSMFAHHLYERATLARLAQLFHKPYALTSQTVGPLIYDEDRALLAELFSHAVLVGCREAATARLVREIAGAEAPVVRQMDDAFSLAPGAEDRAAVADLTGEPFVLASFAEKGSSPTLSDAAYRDHLVATVRGLVERTGRRILLTPHGGALPPAPQTRDQFTDRAIAEAVGSDLVTPVRMLTARQLVALTERADLVVGTRYHAGIFAAGAGVPHLPLVPNLYSSVRMRGAAQNVGMEEFVLPISQVEAVVGTAAGLLSGSSDAPEVLARVATERRAEHGQWWDMLVDALRSGRPGTSPHAQVDALPNPFVGEPAALVSRLDGIEESGKVHAVLARRVEILDRSLSSARARLEKLEGREHAELTALRDRVQALEEDQRAAERPSPSAARLRSVVSRARGAARRRLRGGQS